MRIRLVGPPGSGKTTLANAVSKELDIPVVHMDRFRYDTPTTEIENSRKIQQKKFDEAMYLPSWIMEGVFFKEFLQSYQVAHIVAYHLTKPEQREYNIQSRAQQLLQETQADTTGIQQRTQKALKKTREWDDSLHIGELQQYLNTLERPKDIVLVRNAPGLVDVIKQHPVYQSNT